VPHDVRNAFLAEDVSVPGEMTDEDFILKEYCCQNCGEPFLPGSFLSDSQW